MANRTTRRRNTRVDVDTSPSGKGAAALQVSQRNLRANVGTNRGGERTANALINAFSAGTDLYNEIGLKNVEKDSAEGKALALSGEELTPEQQQNRSILRGYTNATARAQAIEAGAQMEIAYQELDPDVVRNWTPQDLQKWTSSFHEETWKGLDFEDDFDAETMRAIAPILEQQELELIANHQVSVENHFQAETDAAQKVIDVEALDSGTFSWDEINARYYSTYVGNANDEIMENLVPQLIARGETEKLEELRDRTHWNGGAVAPGGNGKYATVLNNAVLQARSQREYMKNRDYQEQQRAHNEWQQNAGNAVMANIMVKENIGAVPGMVQALVAAGMDWQVGNQLLNTANAFKNLAIGDAAPDGNKMLEIELLVQQGQYNLDNLVADADSYTFGTGTVGQKNFARLASLIRTVENAERQDPLFKSKVAGFVATRTAPRTVEDAYPSIEVNRARTLTKLYELLDAGQSIDDAIQAVNADPNFALEGDKWWEAHEGSPEVLTVDDALKGWRNGNVYSAADIVSTKPSDFEGDDNDYILSLLEAGKITRDQFDALENELED